MILESGLLFGPPCICFLHGKKRVFVKKNSEPIRRQPHRHPFLNPSLNTLTEIVVVNICTDRTANSAVHRRVIGRFLPLLHASGTVCHFTSLRNHRYRLLRRGCSAEVSRPNSLYPITDATLFLA